MAISVSVRGAEQLRVLSRELKRQGRGELTRNLRREIRAAARPVVSDLRGAVRRVQVTSSGGGAVPPDTSTQLRERTARSITVSVTGQKGIRIKADHRKIGPYGKTLPKKLDATMGRHKRWRHPVFARKGTPRSSWTWVEQQGRPWFFTTINRHRRTFRKACFDAMDKTAKEITG